MSEINEKVVAIIEEKLGVDKAEKIATVGDAIAYIEENAK